MTLRWRTVRLSISTSRKRALRISSPADGERPDGKRADRQRANCQRSSASASGER